MLLEDRLARILVSELSGSKVELFLFFLCISMVRTYNPQSMAILDPWVFI